MKKGIVGFAIFLLFLSGCGGAKIDFTIEKAPDYKPEQSYPIIVRATEDGGTLTGLEITAILEMEKMDHGTIEVAFIDHGDGLYEGEVELPMAGEWIADIKAELDGKTYEKVLTFEVKEG